MTIVEIEKFIQLTFDTDRPRNEKSETGRIDRAKTLVMQCRCTKKRGNTQLSHYQVQ